MHNISISKKINNIFASKLNNLSDFKFWTFGSFVYFFAFFFIYKPELTIESQFIISIIAPLIICSVVYLWTRNQSHKIISYVLFFTISLTSLIGATETLTGSHAEAANPFLFGLSFYSASLAYLIYSGKLRTSSPWVPANPLLLSTGPLALFATYKPTRVAHRLNYYLPYIILGLFLHQMISTPLTETFFLIQETDVISALTFAVIFELFVYTNFCGLSLVVFGLAGLAGYRIPLNFRQPFSTTNVVDFWKGWHTSLSAVLKTLFYNPCRARFSTSVAIAAVFLASAMWHGVSLNFLIWGLLHAAIFLLTLPMLRRNSRFVPAMLLVVGIILGRMIFADSDTDRLLLKLSFNFEGVKSIEQISNISVRAQVALMIALLFVSLEFFMRETAYFRQRTYKFYRIPIVNAALLIAMVLTVSNDLGAGYAVYGQR